MVVAASPKRFAIRIKSEDVRDPDLSSAPDGLHIRAHVFDVARRILELSMVEVPLLQCWEAK